MASTSPLSFSEWVHYSTTTMGTPYADFFMMINLELFGYHSGITSYAEDEELFSITQEFDEEFDEAYMKDFRFAYIDHLASQDSQPLGLKSCSLMWFDFFEAVFRSSNLGALRSGLSLSRGICRELLAYVLHMRRVREKFLEVVRASLSLEQLALFQLDHHDEGQLFGSIEYSRRLLEAKIHVNDYLVDFWSDLGIDIETPFFGPGY